MARSNQSRKRKRPGSFQLRSSSSHTSSSSSRSNSDDGFRRIRGILGRNAKILYFPDFIRLYAPSLELLATPEQRASKDHTRLWKTIISPLDTIEFGGPKPITSPTLSTKRKSECRESESSLVDDVLWSLVQRRERMKRRGLYHNGNNILIQGYVSASENKQPGARSCPSMRPGVISIHPNSNVSFCKTSNFFRLLHWYVGDEVLRMLLLHTRVFVPVVEENEDDPSTTSSTRCDYMLLCGPTIQVTKLSSKIDHPVSNPNNNKRQASSSSVTKRNLLIKKQKRSSSSSGSTEVLPRKMKPNSTLARSSLFYSNSFIPHVGLPSRHVMNKTSYTAEQLLNSMVGLYNAKGAKRRKRWKRLRQTGMSVCEGLQKGHSQCDYHRLLQRYCPLPKCCTIKQKIESKIPNPTESTSLPQLAQAFTPAENVLSFLTAVLRRVFPRTFWGSELNFLRVLETVKTFVKLRRKERLANKTLMQGIRVTKMKWLIGDRATMASTSRTDHQATTTLALSIFRWLFRSFIIPLLRSNFYVTETEISARQIMFYRKPVWSMFRSLSMSKLLKRQFIEMQAPEAIRRSLSQQLGFSRLRLLPKATGVRPIAQLSMRESLEILKNQDSGREDGNQQLANKLDTRKEPPRQNRRLAYETSLDQPSRPPPGRRWASNKFMSTNEMLSNLFQVLKYECGRKPMLYGAGLESLGEFYLKYRRFIVSVKQVRGTSKHLGLFFGSVDIEKCYDNIKQDHLLDITRQELSEEDYLLQQTKLLYPAGQNQNSVQKKRNHVGPAESYHPLHPTAVGFKGQSTGSIFIDTVKCTLEKKGKILGLLQEHLQGHLLVVAGRYRDRYLVQANGISQGSVLSMLLCNLYYGNVEKSILCERYFCSSRTDDVAPVNFRSSLNLLSRLVDDFVFITTDKIELTTFLKRMDRGNPELGAKINKDKTAASIPVEVEGDTSRDQNAFHGLGGNCDQSCGGLRMFPWCGMLFDTSTGEVLVDYSRFANGKARDNLTVDSDGSEGKRLKFRMQGFVRPRCLPILFDSAINGLTVVVTNYYQIMLLGAIKTVEYLRSSDIYFTNQANIDFFLLCIHNVSATALGLIRRGLKRASFESFRCDKFCLSTRTSSWLCWQAFCDVFSQLEDFQYITSSLTLQLARNGQHSSLQGTVARAFQQFQFHGLLPVKVR